MSVPPPGTSQERWVQLLDLTRQMDDRYNRAESVGKPRLTCVSGTEQVCDSARIQGDPGAASTAPGQAESSREGPDVDER